MMYEIVGLSIHLVPVIYIMAKNGRYKILFCAACYGFVSIASLLLELVVLPLEYFVFDKFENFIFEAESIRGFDGVLSYVELVKDAFPVVIIVAFMVFAPMLVYRKYEIFKSPSV